jgi:hypothetical protein
VGKDEGDGFCSTGHGTQRSMKKDPTKTDRFEKAIQLLSCEIGKMACIGNQDCADELRTVIRILREGQGYLTSSKPVKVIFYSEL